MKWLKKIKKKLDEPSKYEKEHYNWNEFREAVKKAYKDQYKFGEPVDGNEDRLYVPDDFGGKHIYMCYIKSQNTLGYVDIVKDDHYINKIYLKWLETGKNKIELM